MCSRFSSIDRRNFDSYRLRTLTITRICKILKNQGPTHSNMSNEARKPLAPLKCDESIHIIKADKSDVIFILSRLDYDSKVLEHKEINQTKKTEGKKAWVASNRAKAKTSKCLSERKEFGKSLFFPVIPKTKISQTWYTHTSRCGLFFGIRL